MEMTDQHALSTADEISFDTKQVPETQSVISELFSTVLPLIAQVILALAVPFITFIYLANE